MLNCGLNSRRTGGRSRSSRASRSASVADDFLKHIARPSLGGTCRSRTTVLLPLLIRLRSCRTKTALLVTPLRPDDLALASNTLGGRGKRHDDCGSRLRRWQERVEEHGGRQKPEVDRSAEHWLSLSPRSERRAGCLQLLTRTIRYHTGCGYRAASLVRLPDHLIFPCALLTGRRRALAEYHARWRTLANLSD